LNVKSANQKTNVICDMFDWFLFVSVEFIVQKLTSRVNDCVVQDCGLAVRCLQRCIHI